MSVSLKLSRLGKKNQPVFRIIVAPTRYKRNGRYIDTLGFYDPNTTPSLFKFERKKFSDWVNKGAIISPGLRKILPMLDKSND